MMQNILAPGGVVFLKNPSMIYMFENFCLFKERQIEHNFQVKVRAYSPLFFRCSFSDNCLFCLMWRVLEILGATNIENKKRVKLVYIAGHCTREYKLLNEKPNKNTVCSYNNSEFEKKKWIKHMQSKEVEFNAIMLSIDSSRSSQLQSNKKFKYTSQAS